MATAFIQQLLCIKQSLCEQLLLAVAVSHSLLESSWTSCMQPV